MNFSNQAGANSATLAALRVPSSELQRPITAELQRRRAETHRLRAEANALWSEAKQRFEE